MNPVIQLEQTYFGYSRQKRLFDNLNLELQSDHIYGLLGKNGAGKSTLLRIIVGLLYPDRGTLRVAGYDPGRRQPAFLQELFFIPEEIYLPAVTIEKYKAALAPFYPNFNEEQFHYYLSEFDVAFHGKLSDLSFGQRKKVLIAFAMATNTRILIMDEPTNGLDIPSKSQFRRLVASVLEADRVIMISTHQVRDLDHLIDAVIVLDENEIILHQSLDYISERLHFATLTSMEEDQRILYRILYAEPSLKGYTVVMENTERKESKVDLERLFNAVISNPARIRQLFR